MRETGRYPASLPSSPKEAEVSWEENSFTWNLIRADISSTQELWHLREPYFFWHGLSTLWFFQSRFIFHLACYLQTHVIDMASWERHGLSHLWKGVAEPALKQKINSICSACKVLGKLFPFIENRFIFQITYLEDGFPSSYFSQSLFSHANQHSGIARALGCRWTLFYPDFRSPVLIPKRAESWKDPPLNHVDVSSLGLITPFY